MTKSNIPQNAYVKACCIFMAALLNFMLCIDSYAEAPQAPSTVQADSNLNGKPAMLPSVKKTQDDEEIQIPGPKPYIYDPSGRRDPFMSILDVNKMRRGELRDNKPARILTPLESADLSQITLVGVVINSQYKYAVVTLKDGKSFTITKGTSIGINGGTVYQIETGKIIIKETSVDDYGKQITRLKPLCLYVEEGEECK